MLNWTEVERLAKGDNPAPSTRVEKSAEEWRELLTPEQFRVTRAKGTERRFASDLCERFDPGVYACVCCGTKLFDADSKFDSGSGWPAFTEPVAPNVVSYIGDFSFGMTRVETTCSVCDAHLGHVFPDGPKESTGLRFCINAVALKKL